ncbi:MAG: hypothetical protein A2Y88_13950 [Chloroflexi bacterium RBG_13_48_10]|nr:MAG: hypothetical protein A2Y88_13950 [Chloroflexi bacterium RBG_13_48_10]
MKKHTFSCIFLLILLISLTGNVQAIPQTTINPKALVFVNLVSPDDLTRFSLTQLPLYRLLDGGLLTGAGLKDQQTLKTAGLNFQVIDPDLQAGTYYLAETRPSRPAPDFTVYGRALLNTANGVLLHMDPSQADALAQAGVELSMITLTPKPLPAAQTQEALPEAVVPDPIIQMMID